MSRVTCDEFGKSVPAAAPKALLVNFQQRWNVRRRNTQFLKIFRRIRAAIASGDLPVSSGPVEHDRKIAFIGVGGAKRPIVRNRDMQDLPEFFRYNLAHLLNVFRIAQIPGDGRDNDAEKGESGSHGNVSAKCSQ